jgi:aerobic-type carbon monoxide dehydrogenase small subunit (CoxS/CutS family)
VTTLALTINGRAHGPRDVRDDLTMNDFLREYLGMTGTKFGCGAAQCLSCTVIIDDPDGTSYTSPTCIVPAVSFRGKSIRTVEGLAKNGELSVLQKAFIEHFAFQCGYCTSDFLSGARCCSIAWPESPWRGAISRRPLPRRSTAICAAAPATSNITRPCAT